MQLALWQLQCAHLEAAQCVGPSSKQATPCAQASAPAPLTGDAPTGQHANTLRVASQKMPGLAVCICTYEYVMMTVTSPLVAKRHVEFHSPHCSIPPESEHHSSDAAQFSGL